MLLATRRLHRITKEHSGRPCRSEPVELLISAGGASIHRLRAAFHVAVVDQTLCKLVAVLPKRISPSSRGGKVDGASFSSLLPADSRAGKLPLQYHIVTIQPFASLLSWIRASAAKGKQAARSVTYLRRRRRGLKRSIWACVWRRRRLEPHLFRIGLRHRPPESGQVRATAKGTLRNNCFRSASDIISGSGPVFIERDACCKRPFLSLQNGYSASAPTSRRSSGNGNQWPRA